MWRFQIFPQGIFHPSNQRGRSPHQIFLFCCWPQFHKLSPGSSEFQLGPGEPSPSSLRLCGWESWETRCGGRENPVLCQGRGLPGGSERGQRHLGGGSFGWSIIQNIFQIFLLLLSSHLSLSGTDSEPGIFVPKKNVLRQARQVDLQKPVAAPVCHSRKSLMGATLC